MSDSRIEAIRNLAESPSGTPSADEGVKVAIPVKSYSLRITGADLLENTIVIGDGEKYSTAPLAAKEAAAILKICHKAYRRAALSHMETVLKGAPKRGRPAGKAKATGKKRGRPAGSKNKTAAPSGEPKRRGRPPKNRPVTYEAPAATPAPAAEVQ